jgi:hypothetical protein
MAEIKNAYIYSENMKGTVRGGIILKRVLETHVVRA